MEFEIPPLPGYAGYINRGILTSENFTFVVEERNMEILGLDSNSHGVIWFILKTSVVKYIFMILILRRQGIMRLLAIKFKKPAYCSKFTSQESRNPSKYSVRYYRCHR